MAAERGEQVLGPHGEVSPAAVIALDPGKPPGPEPRAVREGKA
jgi:hypothetical protein